MSKTIVDMAKATQVLDSGWTFRLYRGGMGSYIVIAEGNEKQMERMVQHQAKFDIDNPDLAGVPLFMDEDGECVTDDFTPEQALTRAAYKVHGEILGSDESPEVPHG